MIERMRTLQKKLYGCLLIRFNSKIYKLLRHNQGKKSKISIRDFQHRQRNQEHIGRAFLIFIQNKIYYYLIVLELLGLNSLFQIMIKI